jgi:hypothetical protein
MAKRSVEAETAATLRQLLEAVEQGELEPGGERGVALMRRMEGAAVALEASAEATGPGRSRRRQKPA